MKKVCVLSLKRNAKKLLRVNSKYYPKWQTIENASRYRNILLSLNLEAREIDFDSFSFDDLNDLKDIYAEAYDESIEPLVDGLGKASELWKGLNTIFTHKGAIEGVRFI